MKNRVKKLVNFRFDCSKDLEMKLERWALKGLFLEESGPYLWTFKKSKPKKVKYAVTYFSEGSLFNPGKTENQQTFFEYAKASGWDFITEFNQMQIFCSDSDNPVPFETDEREKLKNIRNCMKKSFLPSNVALIVVFSLNLFGLYYSFLSNPVDFLSDVSRLLSAFAIFSVVIYFIYILLDYLIWCQRSEKSIASGGACIEKPGRTRRLIDMTFLCCIFGCCGGLFAYLAFKTSWLSLALGMVQIPVLSFIFSSSIRYLKRKKASAMVNRVISSAVLIFGNFTYFALIMMLIFNFGIRTGGRSDYRTVTWEITPTITHEYRRYSDIIPLTCEDLYGVIEYEYYSYEKEVESTIFLTRSCYRQDSLPAQNAPPSMEYEILEPQFKFVHELSKKHMIEKLKQWNSYSIRQLDYQIFDMEAYQGYYEDSPNGSYLLISEDRMIQLKLEEPATPEQIVVIKEKLQL